MPASGSAKKFPVIWVLLFAGLLFFTFTIFFFLQSLKQIRGVERGTELPILGDVPAFRLEDAGGNRIGLEDLRGSVWVADFIFTRCQGPCPLISARMAELQGKFDPSEKVRLISFTVDPDFDTGKVLMDYAAKMGAQDGRWYFLRGEKEKVFSLAEKGFFLPVGEGVTDPKHAVFHSTRLVLVDQRGKIRGYYESMDPDAVMTLLRDIHTLLQKHH